MHLSSVLNTFMLITTGYAKLWTEMQTQEKRYPAGNGRWQCQLGSKIVP